MKTANNTLIDTYLKKIVIVVLLLVIPVTAFSAPNIRLFSPLVTVGNKNNLNGELLEVSLDQDIKINWIYENDGSTSEAAEIRYYLSNDNVITLTDQYLGSDSIQAAAPSAGSTTKILQLSVPTGFYTIGACSQATVGFRCRNAGRIRVLRGSTTVPDIGLFSPLISVGARNNLNGGVVTMRAGEQFRVGWIIENYGIASNNVRIEYYLSNDSTITRTDSLFATKVITVGEGDILWLGGVAINRVANFEPGTYRVGTCAPTAVAYECRVAGTIRVLPELATNIIASITAAIALLLE